MTKITYRVHCLDNFFVLVHHMIRSATRRG